MLYIIQNNKIVQAIETDRVGRAKKLQADMIRYKHASRGH